MEIQKMGLPAWREADLSCTNIFIFPRKLFEEKKAEMRGKKAFFSLQWVTMSENSMTVTITGMQ